MLKDKVAIVTGSTSGIGLGIAKALAAEGCSTVLNSFIADAESERLAQQIAQETGSKTLFVKADMSHAREIRDLIARTEAVFGKVDILVNNAGIQHVQPLEDFPVERWDMVIATNLSAAFHSTRAVLAGMKTRKFGRIINIASAHGLVASAYKSAYVAAKHGIVGLTKVTALEGAEHGVTANAICPGYVWTPLVAKQIPEQAKAHGLSDEEVVRKVLLANQPTKEFASVDEIGALTVLLASDLAKSVTGTAIPVDGGWTAH